MNPPAFIADDATLRSLTTGRRLGLAVVLAALACAVGLAVVAVFASEFLPATYAAAGGIVAALALALLAAPGVRDVARHTFAQCLRTRVLAAFLFLLAVAMAVIGTQSEGDGTLAGLTRTFLSYSIWVTGGVLSLVTIFLAAGLISNDVRKKQVFGTATKPLPRWQYVVGRWLGLVGLMALLLGIAMGVIYGVAGQLRSRTEVAGRAVTPVDRLAVETEVFTARRAIAPKPIDVEGIVRRRLVALASEPQALQAAVEKYRLQSGLDEQGALAAIEAEFRKQERSRLQTTDGLTGLDPNDIAGVLQYAGATQRLQWLFEGLSVRKDELQGTGTVGRTARDPAGRTVLVEIAADPRLIGRLMHMGPVRVGAEDGRVERIEPDHVWVRLLAKDSGSGPLAEGAQVALTVEPTIQIEYKGSLVQSGEDTLRGLWVASNPTSGAAYIQWRDDPAKGRATLTVPGRVVDDRGRMALEFINRSPSSVSILQEDVRVMVRADSFEANMIRASLLMLTQIMFLSAAGIWAGSFLGFEVACLVCFAMLPFSAARGFLSQAVDPSLLNAEDVGAGIYIAKWLFQGMAMLLPDFAQTSPGPFFVDGLAIFWSHLGAAGFFQIIVRAAPLLVLACVIFHRRELARVQV